MKKKIDFCECALMCRNTIEIANFCKVTRKVYEKSNHEKSLYVDIDKWKSYEIKSIALLLPLSKNNCDIYHGKDICKCNNKYGTMIVNIL